MKPGFEHSQNLFQPLLILQSGLHQNFPHHGEEHIHLRIKRLSPDLKCSPEFFFLHPGHIRIQLQRSADTSCIYVDLIKQLPILVIRCVDDAQHTLKDSRIGEQFLLNTGQIKHERYITNPVGLHIVMDYFDAVRIYLVIKDLSNLPGNVCPAQNRYLFQLFLGRLLFLICLQFLCCFYKLLHLFFRKALFIFFKPFCQFPVHAGGTPFFRPDNNDRTVCVIQQIFLDQFLKITCFNIFL